MLTHKEFSLICFHEARAETLNEWAVTKYYYAAVHAVNHGIFGSKPCPGHYKHEQRRVWLDKNSPFFAEYLALEDFSHTSRYCPHQHPMPTADRDKTQRLAEVLLKSLNVVS